MRVGEAWYLDTRKGHRARNLGDEDRVHLVMDVESNSELLELLKLPADVVSSIVPGSSELGGPDLVQSEVAPEPIPEKRTIEPVVPTWICGDSRSDLPNGEVDLVFSCPPYFDLEVYGDNESDLSNAKNYDSFLASYRTIISEACARLKEDRFACFVVGDIRDKKGRYRNFVGDTVTALLDAGLHLYNDAILVTPVSTLALRAARPFNTSRKLGKTHQNVLVFCKGDPIKATEWCGDCEFGTDPLSDA